MLKVIAADGRDVTKEEEWLFDLNGIVYEQTGFEDYPLQPTEHKLVIGADFELEKIQKQQAFLVRLVMTLANGDCLDPDEERALDNIASDLGAVTMDPKEFHY